MKKLIALMLALITLVLSLTGCFFGKYIRGNIHYNLDWTAMQTIYAKVEADHIIFDKNDVTLDFYYGLYETNEVETLVQIREHYHYIPSEEEEKKGVRHTESNFAIYISNNAELVYEKDDNGFLLDPKDKVNAKLWKFISFKEAFDTNYGYKNSALDLIYNHSDKITIPTEFFIPGNNRVYIHIVRLPYMPQEQLFSSFYDYHKCTIEYTMVGNSIILR